MKQRNKAVFFLLILMLILPLFLWISNVAVHDQGKDLILSRDSHTGESSRGTLSDKVSLDAVRFGEGWQRIRDKDTWRRFSTIDGDYAELVIGLNNYDVSVRAKLSDLILNHQGKIVDQIKVKGETRALVAEIAFEQIQVFAEKALDVPDVRYVEPNAKMEVDFTPNDPGWPKQWGPAAIQADFAWNTTLGSSSVLVAVVDTGVDYTHPDLQANYVPLGYDWVNDDADPMDDHGHGTHVAGIIAAQINNNEGMAGLSQVRVMAEKGLTATGSGSDDNLAKAIIHAADQGANIISMSWGGYSDSQILHDALRYAYDEGALLVAAAGNDPVPIYHFPAAYEEVVAVAATNRSDTIASFSTYGDWVDISAPGVKIYSTISKNHTWNITYPYANASGTSMACPHVSGVAALVWSQFPDLTRDEVQLRLYSTADDLGDKGFDTHFGHGRINAKNALEPKPDHELILRNWKHRPYAMLDQVNNFTISMYNYGKTDEENVMVQLSANGSIVDSRTISHFSADTFETLVLSWNPTIASMYNVTASIVPVAGEKTTNNAVWIMMMAGSRVSLSVPQDYPTIQGAVDVAMPGDTIEVASGTYNEYVMVFTSGLKFVGENMYTTIVDANNTGTSPFVLWSVGYISITGFTLQNGFDMGLFNVGKGGEYFNVSNNILNGAQGNIVLRTNNSIVSENLLVSSEISVFGRENAIRGNVGGSIGIGGTDNVVSNNHAFGSIWVEGNRTLVSHNAVTDSVDYSAFTIKGEENTVVDNEVANVRERGFSIFGRRHLIARNQMTNIRSVGINMEDASDVRLEDNVIFGAGRGIYLLHDCYNNTLVRNTVLNTRDGIDVVRSSNNTFMQNIVSDSSSTGIYILLANSNSFTGNMLVSRCQYGIYLGHSTGNVIAENVTLRDNGYGLWLENAVGNMIYHDNFVNNTHHVRLDSASSNTWDKDGMGNYWDDYAGVDLFSGPYQNETGGDGIGDTPYVIDANNTDPYPLMSHYQWSPHDVGITRITVSKTRVVPGSPLQVNVTVFNYGMFTENFNMSVYANTSVLQMTSATLASRASAVITFSWNTTGLISGNYTISALVHPIPSEENTSNNAFTDGQVEVLAHLTGDVTGPEGWPDGKVDIRDLALIAAYFGQNVPPAPSKCDLTGPLPGVPDGKVDIRDIAAAAKNYGKVAY